MLQHVCITYKVKALTWASCAYAAHTSNQTSCPLGSLHCVEESACYFPLKYLGDLRLRKCHFEKGKGHIGKALESNQPFYIPNIFQLPEDDCPYYPLNFRQLYFFEDCVGVLVLKLKSLYANSSDYVVEFLLPHDNTSIREEALIDNIIGALKNRKTSFVTCRNIHGPLVELREYATEPERNQATLTIVDVESFTEIPLNVDTTYLKRTQEDQEFYSKITRACYLSERRLVSLGSKGFRNLKNPRQTCGSKRKINENCCDESMLDQDKICSDMAKWIVKCNVPLSIVEHESFKSFLNRLEPRFDLKPFLQDWSKSPKGGKYSFF